VGKEKGLEREIDLKKRGRFACLPCELEKEPPSLPYGFLLNGEGTNKEGRKPERKTKLFPEAKQRKKTTSPAEKMLEKYC